MNELFLIGKIHEICDKEDKEYQFILEVKRHYKNEIGEFVNDYLKCKIWKGAMDVMLANCKIGDVVAIKARIEASNYENMVIIAEKIRFIYKDNKFQKN